ncbi:hypothetical protein [Achromobacter sp. ESBL13]|uniref:hypothetical protein n=1 Tax=Achromobacter sp. ESBL13 TaxID=3077328 RepID=UPI002FCC14DE
MKAKPLFPALEIGKTILNTLLKAGVALLPHRIKDAKEARWKGSKRPKKKRHKGAYS